MSATITETSYDQVSASGQLKQFYNRIKMQQLIYEHMPAIGIVPKDESLQGLEWKQPFAFAVVPNRSANFQIAQNPWFYANNGTSATGVTASSITTVGYPQVGAFICQPVQDYGTASISRMTKKLSETSDGGFIESATEAMSMAMKAVMLSLGNAIYGDGTGTIGQISSASNVATATITLANPNHIVNFYVGQVLVATNGLGGVVRGSSAGLAMTEGIGAMVVAVDRNLGTVTVGTAPAVSQGSVLSPAGQGAATADWNALISGVTAGDYLCQVGDAQNGALASGGQMVKLQGFTAWVPSAAPTAGVLFNNVDRSSDTMLSGCRVNAVGLEIEEAILEGAALGARQGAKLDTCFLDYSLWTALQFALTARRIYTTATDSKVYSSDGTVGYSSIKLEGGTGLIDVIPDPFAASAGFTAGQSTILLLQKDTWSLKTVGKAVSPFDVSGNSVDPENPKDESVLLRAPNADSYEFRCGMYGNLSCNAPGWNVNIQIGTPNFL